MYAIRSYYDANFSDEAYTLQFGQTGLLGITNKLLFGFIDQNNVTA